MRETVIFIAQRMGIPNPHEGLEYSQQTNRKCTIHDDYLKDVSVRHGEMKAPKVRDSLSWGKRKGQHSAEGVTLISAAESSQNKFSNDGSFMCEFVSNKSSNSNSSALEGVEPVNDSSEANTPGNSNEVVKTGITANQLAAKAMKKPRN
ncbi:hypothetical protein PIB30_026725 [Stylosanthes scabra]|uniref:Uncharacterized protein n=1 Tax=Stylosanthes scabra TaxID=79078 RepID=A0ABU6TB95_9FABA|nr:hypothetical protein [Stylosanthes scabra]